MKNAIYLIFLFFLLFTLGCKQKEAGTEGEGGAGGSLISSEASIKLLQDAVKKDPSYARAWLQLGNEYMDTQQDQQAVDAYGRYLELVPGDVNARVDMGTCYHRLGLPEKALEEYRIALKLNPNHPMAHFNSAVVLARDLGRGPEAAAEFERFLALDPAYPKAAALREDIKRLKQQPAGK